MKTIKRSKKKRFDWRKLFFASKQLKSNDTTPHHAHIKWQFLIWFSVVVVLLVVVDWLVVVDCFITNKPKQQWIFPPKQTNKKTFEHKRHELNLIVCLVVCVWMVKFLFFNFVFYFFFFYFDFNHHKIGWYLNNVYARMHQPNMIEHKKILLKKKILNEMKLFDLIIDVSNTTHHKHRKILFKNW